MRSQIGAAGRRNPAATRRNQDIMIDTTPKTRIITLTNRQPVKVREDLWPTVAHGTYGEHDNQYEFQANRIWKCNVRVRQHQDGRAIVYGIYSFESQFQDERDFEAKAGLLLDTGADLISAIRSVGETLTDAAIEAGHEDFAAHISAAVRDCVADLPAEELE